MATITHGTEIQQQRVQHDSVVSSFDKPLLYTVLVLIGFGLVAVYTASASQALAETGNSLSILMRQCIAVIIGFIGMVILSKIDFRFWRKTSQVLGIIAISMLVLTMFVGNTANGAERWILLPFGFQFQPSDPAKIAAIILLAQAVANKRFYHPTLWINLLLVGSIIILIFQQPNLSVALILGTVAGTMFYVGGFPLFIFITALPMGLYVVYNKIMSTPYQMARIEGWLNPWENPTGSGYNLIQSYFAIGSGGLLGVGFGHSVQKLYYLPFQHTDFIFSVICEELGFLGALVLISLFVFLGYRGFRIAVRCPDRYGQLLAFGLTLALVLQALINLCVTTGLMPVTGVTLPLISYGGTSMITSLAMIGILLNISRYKLNPRLPQQQA